VQQRKQRLGAIAQERTRWQGRLETANKQIETLEERLASTRAEREALEGVPAQVEEKAKALMDKLSEAETTRKEAADALATAENELRAADTANKEANDALAKARETRARIDAMLEGARNQVAEAARQIQEAFECAPAQVLAAGEISADEELPPLEDVERKLERYKRERENMGAVNLRAEEESREAEEQLQSMQNERGDLEQAIAKLRQGIGSLNKEGRQRLLDAFGTVNDNFSRLFTRLFGGGTAHLELVESDDPLEAGLEIFARPPGKRLTTLSLLSGGEQALTAMSLVFAVFLTNPSPICVLDEVDAPLDDANVERFCKLLEDMRTETETRFLVITHHPLTMANMDRLFGVTMAEPGVSQLVSVDLAGAEAIREAG
jgi:chromosome segregation protein